MHRAHVMDYKTRLEAYEERFGKDENLLDMHRQLQENKEVTNRKNVE